MKKLKAFSLAEIAIAMIIVMIISAIGASYFKPKTQKLKLFTYATISNLQKGNSAIMSKYQSLISESANAEGCPANQYSVGCTACSGTNCTTCHDGYKLVDYSAGGTVRKVCEELFTETTSFYSVPAGYDGYCLRLADSFTLKEAAMCETKSAGNSSVNMTFSNGSTIQGLTTPWVTPYDGADYKFKNIVLDIDGDKGANKVWVDRVPLRIYAGGALNGTVMPVSCVESSGDYVYNGDTKVVLDETKRNLYCKQGFDASGSYANKNFLLDNEVATFDIFRMDTVDEDAVGKIVLEGASLMKASCGAYGGEGVFASKDCASFDDDTIDDVSNKKGMRIHRKCVTSTYCNTCWKDGESNMCPRTDDGADVSTEQACLEIRNKYNPDDISCFMLPHKPTMGAGFIFNGMLDNIDY